MDDDEHKFAWPAPPTQPARSPRPTAQVWRVQALLLAVADTLSVRLGAVAVEGEVVGWTRAASGHAYFSLKDARGQALLRCAMFRRAASLLGFVPRDGMRLVARGRVSVYEVRGELQLVVESLSLAGEGELYERFLRSKAALGAEGLFDASRKRALPMHVRRVGVVTSLAAAALHDVVTTLARRSPHVGVVVYPSAVQGVDAPDALVRAIETACSRAEVDVVLLVRGGGSLEDLWAFNDERVVRAVADATIPLVAGVGHESDVTLVDLAADVRAATPTAAAEIAAPDREALLEGLAALARRAMRATAHRLEQQMVRFDRAALLAGRPARVVEIHRRRLDQLDARLPTGLRQALRANELRLHHLRARLELAVTRCLGAARQRSGQLQVRLDALDPRRVLRRGYAWIADVDGRPIVTVQRLTRGDAVQAVLADGRVDARVERVDPTPGADAAAAPSGNAAARG